MKPRKQLALALAVGCLGGILAFGRSLLTRPWYYSLLVSAVDASSCTYYVDNSSLGSDSNNGTSLVTPWKTIGTKLAATTLSGGQVACLVGQATPNTTNGGIWRETYSQAGGGTAWGTSTEVDVTSYDPTKPAIITGADCYGAASGMCTGSTAVTWHHCTSGDSLCNNSTNVNITNVYEYTRPTAVQAAIYVDDPDVINGTTLWTDATKVLKWASGLPGAGSTRGSNHYQGDMTAGTFYDDGTHLYVWTGDASDPGTHALEAVTRQSATGSVKMWSTSNAYTKYSYIKFIYTMVDGIDIETGTSTGAGIPFKADHLLCGGLGVAGGVTNEGSYYGGCVQATESNGAQPTGTVTTADVTITNSIVNWAGRSGFLVGGTSGSVLIQGNIIGPFEHTALDDKCPYNVTFQNNYVHDNWTANPIGSDSGSPRNSLYIECDWNACSGGTVTFVNNTLYNVNNGVQGTMGGACTSSTNTWKVFNNTIYGGTGFANAGAGLFVTANSGDTVTLDAENNIFYLQMSGSDGFQQSSSSGTYTLTEKNNLYDNSTGTNTNVKAGTSYTTLATWQGTGLGAGDLWQKNPFFSDLPNGVAPYTAGVVPTYRLFNYSPAINAGGTTTGTTSRTLGGTAEVVGGMQ